VIYAGDVTLLCKDINIMNTIENLLDASKEVDLEANAEKTRYMFMSCHLIRVKNLYLNVPNKSSENVARFQCVGMMRKLRAA
jgi:hypothetical protein